MTIVQINIPDDLAQAAQKAIPAGTLEHVLENLLRAEVARLESVEQRRQGIVEGFRRLRDSAPSVTDDEIRAIRDELRS